MKKGFTLLPLLIVTLLLIFIVTFVLQDSKTTENSNNKEESCAEEVKRLHRTTAPHSIDFCNNRKAQEKRDGKYCNKIDNLNIRTSCKYELAVLTGSIEECDSVGDDSSIQPVDNRDVAEYECYTKIAINKGEAELCQLIESKPYGSKDRCLLLVAREISDINVCEMMIKGTAYYDECLYFFELNKLQ